MLSRKIFHYIFSISIGSFSWWEPKKSFRIDKSLNRDGPIRGIVLIDCSYKRCNWGRTSRIIRKLEVPSGPGSKEGWATFVGTWFRLSLMRLCIIQTVFTGARWQKLNRWHVCFLSGWLRVRSWPRTSRTPSVDWEVKSSSLAV